MPTNKLIDYIKTELPPPYTTEICGIANGGYDCAIDLRNRLLGKGLDLTLSVFYPNAHKWRLKEYYDACNEWGVLSLNHSLHDFSVNPLSRYFNGRMLNGITNENSILILTDEVWFRGDTINECIKEFMRIGKSQNKILYCIYIHCTNRSGFYNSQHDFITDL